MYSSASQRLKLSICQKYAALSCLLSVKSAELCSSCSYKHFIMTKMRQFCASSITGSVNKSLPDFPILEQGSKVVHPPGTSLVFKSLFCPETSDGTNGNQRAHWVLLLIMGLSRIWQTSAIIWKSKRSIHTMCMKVFYKASCWKTLEIRPISLSLPHLFMKSCLEQFCFN